MTESKNSVERLKEKLKGILNGLRDDAEKLAGWLGAQNQPALQPIPIPARERPARRSR